MKVLLKTMEELKQSAQEVLPNGDLEFKHEVWVSDMDKYAGTVQVVNKIGKQIYEMRPVGDFGRTDIWFITEEMIKEHLN